jgi:hypothetical protein
MLVRPWCDLAAIGQLHRRSMHLRQWHLDGEVAL